MLRSIILPAFNEQEHIAEMVAGCLRAGSARADPVEVIVVDNASADDTARIVKEIAGADKRVRLITHPENRLYAGSCLTGTRAARGDRLFIIDSDGQHPPEDMWAFDAQLEAGFDVVFGWRRQRQESRGRVLLSHVLTAACRACLGFPFHDVNCGIRGFSRRFADQLEIAYGVNLVNPELWVRARQGGFLTTEVAVVQEHRKGGTSSQELGRGWRLIRPLSSYLIGLRRELKNPRQDPAPPLPTAAEEPRRAG